MSYIFLSLFAAVAFALANLIQKFTSKHAIGNFWVLGFYLYATTIPFVLIIPLLFDIKMPTVSIWPFIILYAAAHFADRFFFAAAIYRLDASSFTPFFQLQSAFIALFAYLFLSENFSPIQYVFIALMVIGAILVSFNEQLRLRAFFTLATVLIVTQQFLHAASNIFAGFAVRAIDAFSFLFWGELVIFAFSFLLIPVLRSKLLLPKSQLKPLFLAGFFSIAGALALFTAFQTNVTISSALALLTSPIVFVLTFFSSIFKPNLLEHHPPRVYLVRAIGVGLVLIGALNLIL